MKNTGFGYLYFTLSAWESVEAMQAFVRSGAHLAALQVSHEVAIEVRNYTFQSNQLPTWKEVRQLLQTKGRVITYH